MTLSRAIRKQEESGRVERATATSDGRAVTVRLSTKGRRLTQRVVVAVENADEASFGRLTPRDLATYKALTAALVGGENA